jgi:hypothetical protein
MKTMKQKAGLDTNKQIHTEQLGFGLQGIRTF